MAESIRTKQLKGLADKLPVANQQVAQGLKSAQDIQLKAQVGQSQGPLGIGQQQQLGATQTQQRGAADLQAAGQTAQQLGQVGKLGLQEKGLQQQQQLGQQERQVSGKQREFQSRLSGLSNSLKDNLLDQQLEFKKDERGRLLLNDRQLADMAVLNAKSEEDFLNYKQATEQAYTRKIAMLEQAHNIVVQELQQSFEKSEGALTREQAIRLKQQAQALQAKIAKEKADAENRNAMWSGAGTIVGVGVGAVFGGPAGAAIGASIGGAAGSTLGAAFG